MYYSSSSSTHVVIAPLLVLKIYTVLQYRVAHDIETEQTIQSIFRTLL